MLPRWNRPRRLNLSKNRFAMIIPAFAYSIEVLAATEARLLLRLDRVTLPDVLERFRQRLPLHRTIGVPRVLREQVLVVIPLRFQHRGHSLIRQYPIMHL